MRQRMARQQKNGSGFRLTNKTLIWLLGIAFGIAILVTALLTYLVVRDTVRAWGKDGQNPIASLGTLVAPTPAVTIASDVPLQSGTGPAAATWDGSSRISILFMGLDYRDWEYGEGPSRTDTMILLTIDPETKTAGMLSIPRDLWVNIPGFNYGKINTAYYNGEAFQVPGGGPSLAMQTVENFLGVPVPFYAQVDFGAFVRMVDEIGGVTVDVPYEMVIDLLGDGDNTIKTLQPGRQTLPGEWALAYARARNTIGGDFDRADRQQQVILGIRERVLNWDMIPVLIQKAPSLYTQISEGIHTNLTLEQIIQLAWVVKDISPGNIARGVIGPEQVDFGTSPEGMSILIPIPDEIRALRDDVFSTVGPINPIATDDSGGTAIEGGNPQELAVQEQARLLVQNGTYSPGLASSTSTLLGEQGLNVVEVSNAVEVYEFTTLIDYSGNPYTIAFLSELLRISPSRIFTSFDPDSPHDIVVILGNDWAFQNNAQP